MSLKVVALVLALGFAALGARAQDDVREFCREFGLANATSSLQVTREVSKTDFVIEAKFKSIHCCARGYRSIEWYVFFYTLLSILSITYVNLFLFFLRAVF